MAFIFCASSMPPDFDSLHLFFEGQYKELFEIIDQIAERIRSLNHHASAALSDYLEITNLTEISRDRINSTGFIKLLHEDHESIIVHLRKKVDRMAHVWKDFGTNDLITAVMQRHEKIAWMLRAHLDGKLSGSL